MLLGALCCTCWINMLCHAIHIIGYCEVSLRSIESGHALAFATGRPTSLKRGEEQDGRCEQDYVMLCYAPVLFLRVEAEGKKRENSPDPPEKQQQQQQQHAIVCV